MKTFPLFALALAFGAMLPLPATAAASSSPAASAEVSRGKAAAQLSYIKAVLHTMDSLSEVMVKMKTKADADAAAPVVEHLLKAMVELTAAGDGLKQPAGASSAEAAEAQLLVEQLNAANARFQSIVDNIPEACMKSQALIDAMNSVQ